MPWPTNETRRVRAGRHAGTGHSNCGPTQEEPASAVEVAEASAGARSELVDVLPDNVAYSLRMLAEPSPATDTDSAPPRS